MTKNDIIGALELAGTAYAPIQPKGTSTLITIDDAPSGVQCFLRRDEDLLRVTFRGSDSKTDWRHNFQFMKKCVCTAIRIRRYGYIPASSTPTSRPRCAGAYRTW